MNHSKVTEWRAWKQRGLKTVLIGDQANLKVADEMLVLGCFGRFSPKCSMINNIVKQPKKQNKTQNLEKTRSLSE